MVRRNYQIMASNKFRLKLDNFITVKSISYITTLSAPHPPIQYLKSLCFVLGLMCSLLGLCLFLLNIRLNNKHIREENRKIVDVKECIAIWIFNDKSSSTSHKKMFIEWHIRSLLCFVFSLRFLKKGSLTSKVIRNHFHV